jgi:transcriptional regulator with XRE-family HTH domain
MTFPERLRMARELGDLASYELAELAGVSGGYPGHLEKGRRKNPGSDVASKIARALGVSLDWLLRGEGPAPTKAQVQAAVAVARDQLAKRKAAKGAA